MSFIVVANPPESTPDKPVNGGTFWPQIDPVHLRAVCSLDGTTTPEKLQANLEIALAEINADLDQERQTWEANGYTTLNDVPGVKVAGTSNKVLAYRGAVYALVMAHLSTSARSADTITGITRHGDNRDDMLRSVALQHRARAHNYLQDVRGRPRITASLL